MKDLLKLFGASVFALSLGAAQVAYADEEDEELEEEFLNILEELDLEANDDDDTDSVTGLTPDEELLEENYGEETVEQWNDDALESAQEQANQEELLESEPLDGDPKMGDDQFLSLDLEESSENNENVDPNAVN
jgi:hypothetical protein